MLEILVVGIAIVAGINLIRINSIQGNRKLLIFESLTIKKKIIKIVSQT